MKVFLLYLVALVLTAIGVVRSARREEEEEESR